jgi:hypothetical protein
MFMELGDGCLGLLNSLIFAWLWPIFGERIGCVGPGTSNHSPRAKFGFRFLLCAIHHPSDSGQEPTFRPLSGLQELL